MRPICCRCHSEMFAQKNGVAVVETAAGAPYKIWMADRYECGGCHARVVVGVGRNPIGQNWEDNFAAKMNELDPETTEWNYERPDERPMLAGKATL